MYEMRDGKHVIEEKLTIDRTPADVFSFVTTAENIPLFWSNITEYEHLSEPLEKGTRATATFKIAGKRIAWTAEVTEIEPDRLLRWRTVEAPFDFEYFYRFEPTDGGTALTYQIVAEEMPGFFGSIANPIVGRMMARDVHASLSHLRDMLEADIDR